MSSFTLIFSFYCNSPSRRKYLNFCIQSILLTKQNAELNVLVIDGSDTVNHELNKTLFVQFNKITIVNDQEKNPILRLSQNMHLVETKYSFKLLEDCLFIGYDFAKVFQADMHLLDTEPDTTVIQYPTLPDQNTHVVNGSLMYIKPKLDYVKFSDVEVEIRLRLLDRQHHNYLCNNVLYNTVFLRRHLKHYSFLCFGHAAAESDRFDRFFRMKYNSDTLVAKCIKRIHKILFSKNIIERNLVTQNYETGVVLHVGYESTELDYFDNPDRTVSKGSDGAINATLANLAKLRQLLSHNTLTVYEKDNHDKISFSHHID